ncbi:GNAT family N-acetyltransferase [Actinacidiphila yeochonensis]|uniref:GNAT family N-acetyltransferase n=1 Tax=Actinacidiphila yeochonensis TaxID=89050 RepID=UPI0005699B7B|nr:GNAT family protein [Actinacidiphila yeochonensis]
MASVLSGVLAPKRFKGNGLLLRPLCEADASALDESMLDPGVLRWGVGRAVATAPADERARIWLTSRLNGWSVGTAAFALTDPREGTLLGYLGLRDVHRVPDQAVAGYWVAPSARGRGVAARALDAASTWAFTPEDEGGLGLHRISLDHALVNPASCRTALRAGFAEEGVMRESFVEPDGTRHDSHLHARLATDPRPDLG